MKKLVSIALAFVLFAGSLPLLALQTGEISGTAMVEGRPLPGVTVRLRNVDSGEIVATSKTGPDGRFLFSGLPIGNYVVETVSDDGTLLGTSSRIALATGAMIVGNVTVSTSAAAAAAAGVGGAAGAGAGAGAAGAGAGAGAGAAAAGGGGFFSSTLGIITTSAIAIGAGYGIYAATKDASGSQ